MSETELKLTAYPTECVLGGEIYKMKLNMNNVAAEMTVELVIVCMIVFDVACVSYYTLHY